MHPLRSSIFCFSRAIVAWMKIIIVGAGILGLATAYQARKKHPEAEIRVLEKEAEPVLHQTGRNSGVIHSGLYYKPGSAKALNCRAGRAMLLEFCSEHDIPHELCGKVVLASDDSQLAALEELYRRGTENGVECRYLAPDELQEHEPHAIARRALFVADAGIVDYRTVAKKLLELSHSELSTGAEVLATRHTGNGLIVESTAGDFPCDHLINCAGLHCDRVCRRTGSKPPLQIVPFKGEYYRLKDSAAHLCRTLIYPVPDPKFPFLGVHLTRRIGGGVDAGPNAVLALGREAYKGSDMNLRDLAQTLVYPGFWRLSARHWRMGLEEMFRSVSKELFTKALQQLCPEVKSSDLIPTSAGIRAQAVRRNGELEDDFRFVTNGRVTNVLNAPSPAATASLSIALEILKQANLD